MPARTLAYTGGKAMSPAITQGRARLSSSTKIKMMRDTTGTAFTADTSGASSSSIAANRAAAAARTTASKHPASQPPQMHRVDRSTAVQKAAVPAMPQSAFSEARGEASSSAPWG